MEECNEKFSELEELLLSHAGLTVLDTKSEGISMQGPVKIKNLWFNIKVICPNYPNLLGVQLHVQQSYHVKTFNHNNVEIDQEKWSLKYLLENIPRLMGCMGAGTQVLTKSCDIPIANQNIYEDIVKLFAPMEYTIELNESCSRVRFSKFSQYEQHYFQLEMPSLKIMEHSLPTCLDWQEIFGKATNLMTLLQQFRKCLDDLHQFYENFTDIDELCYVVQPALPTTKENWRLFVLKEKVFLKLQFSDPFSPLGSMSVHIIGPTPEVSHLRRVYSEGLRDWDGELDVHKNLMRIFDLCFFPMPPPTDGPEEMLQFCNICYSYKLDRGDIPIISCDNTQCSLIFHAECLKEWFSTLADGKTFLDVAFGACPFCKAKLSTSFQEILLQ